MKKEKQIGVRVGLPVMFCMELEDVYKNGAGPHRGITFADWCGLLIGYGLKAYRKEHTTRQAEPPEPSGQENDLRNFDKEEW
jgi:hypothetical protein